MASDIITNLRAIIISSKGGLDLSEVRDPGLNKNKHESLSKLRLVKARNIRLKCSDHSQAVEIIMKPENADYKEAFGQDVPIRALGFNSLEAFFKSNPQNFTIVGNKVHAVVKASSVHIASLVNRQRSSRKPARSKLTTKQARKLRRPTKFEPPPYQRKQSPKLQRPNYLKSPSTHNPTLSSNTKAISASPFSPSTPVLPQTPANPAPPVTSVNRPIPSLLDLPFENFEDLKISETLQSRLLKIKNPNTKPTVSESNSSEISDNWGGSALPSSPFRRSLANNSEEEILSAKKSAQIRLDNSHRKNVRIITQPSPVENIPDPAGDCSYEQKLRKFCLDNRLMIPTYSVLIREPFNQPVCYGCKLNIGDNFQVSTYPVETHTEATARELAAKKAYNQITLNNNLPLSLETENVIKLRAICIEKNLPDPFFKTIECHPKNEQSYFICKVKIGDHILLSSYPEELRDEYSARDVAAKKAYEYLVSDSKAPKEPSKNNNDVVITRIYDIIKTKEYGVWSNKMPFLYLDSYREELQSNWFDLVKNSPKFEIDRIERVGCILRTKNETQVTEDAGEVPVLATLKVPEKNHWEVYVTNVVSSAEIWCRLIGKEYSEAYDTMMTKLELQPPTVCIKKPVEGEVYVVNLEESWNRVRVIEIFQEKGEASVFLIDIGVNETVKLSQLFHLQKYFFSVAPQALLLSLNELDTLAGCEELQSALFHTLLGNTFIAEVVAILDDGGNVSSVNLWDTSTDVDVNVNLKLLDDVIRTIKGPSLPSVSLVREMFVSHIDENGGVYFQSSRQNSQYVDCIISVKLKNCGQLTAVSNMDPKKLYVVRCIIKGSYYRAKLTKILSGNCVQVKFIDFGYEEKVTLQDLFDLEETAIDLATIPSQVVRAKFANLKVINSKVLAKIREFALEQSVLVKVTQMSPGSVPEVELFIRSQVDGTLSSVNNKIISDKELLVPNPPARKKSYVIGLENTLSKNLPMPNIPPIGSYFNVIVTLAAHPGLFSVQPLATQNELMELMFRLQEKCEKTFSKPLSQEEFKIGELYAVKHADEYWYRAYAHASVSSSAFTVCLCDFGDFIMVPAENLMPLSTEFKTFPYQAIRAYLAGIAPANKDWSALDCVKFREMVIEKPFVSQVVEINRDANNPNFITLGLILVDTSTNEDVYIHRTLIEEKIAVLKS